MPLMGVFAFDTETDAIDGAIRTVLIQMCPVDAVTLKDVRCLMGIDCYEQFFDLLEETMQDTICHMFNLNYEFGWMFPYLERYEFTAWDPRQKPGAGHWTAMADRMAVYAVKITNQYGKTLTITDDMRRLGNQSMKSASEGVMRSHPEWFEQMFQSEGITETKERIEEYNNGWFSADRESEKFRTFYHYSILDAFSQAMIARWIISEDLDSALTAASNGMGEALAIRYQGDHRKNLDYQHRRYALMDFKKAYPPLSQDMQDQVEHDLLGGFVFGATGTHEGTFCHVDYSSSYPKEYYNGNMFIGKVLVINPESRYFDRVLQGSYFRWMIVSFDFEIKDTGMPAISGRECVTFDEPMIGRWNKKEIIGHVHRRLYTESYLKELEQHYEISDLQIHEVWYAKRKSGDFAPFIEEMYRAKSEAPKNSIERAIAKLNMNGGIHGKTITKTHRTERVFFGHISRLQPRDTEPEYCSLIGFTAMLNARERLLRHCRLIQEAGYKVMMCDTDSMVVNTSEAEVRRILGDDTFTTEDGGINNLGKFEFETDSDGKTEFHTFKCWGLKRYCEIENGQRRKSAFAGMMEGVQSQLVEWETDGRVYSWKQKGKVMTLYGPVISEVTKHAGAESIYDDGIKMPKWNADDYTLEDFMNCYEQSKERQDYLSELWEDEE